MVITYVFWGLNVGFNEQTDFQRIESMSEAVVKVNRAEYVSNRLNFYILTNASSKNIPIC